MERFASTTVMEAEKEYGLPRERWDDPNARLLQDGDRVVFFITGERHEDGEWSYLADCKGRMCFHGTPSDVPLAWMEEDQIQSCFGIGLASFLAKYASPAPAR